MMGFCILVLLGVFLIPEPARAAGYSCVLEIKTLPSTTQDLYSEIAKKCADFPDGYGKYGMIVYQDGRLIVSVENIALGGVPPISLSYPKKTPLLVGVGKLDIVKDEAVFSLLKDDHGVTLNDICTYREIIVGGGYPYWSAVSAKYPSSIQECASLLWE